MRVNRSVYKSVVYPTVFEFLIRILALRITVFWFEMNFDHFRHRFLFLLFFLSPNRNRGSMYCSLFWWNYSTYYWPIARESTIFLRGISRKNSITNSFTVLILVVHQIKRNRIVSFRRWTLSRFNTNESRLFSFVKNDSLLHQMRQGKIFDFSRRFL